MKLLTALIVTSCTIAAIAWWLAQGRVNRYELYQTENVWTQLLLDTRTGKVWQITMSKTLGPLKLEVNPRPLAGGMFAANRRFELKKTGNVWTYMLLDTENGSAWRCTFSIERSENRGISPALPTDLASAIYADATPVASADATSQR